MKGIDISKWQGNVNMKRVRDEGGVQRVILRSGYGAGNYDQAYATNALAMVNLGMKGGIYHFSYAYSTKMAQDEGKFAVTAAKKFWDKCYICYDFEYDSVNNAKKHGVNVTKSIATAYALAFLKEVDAAGFIPVLYLNQDYWNRYFDVDALKKEIPHLRIWYACWYNANSQNITKDLPANIKKQVDIWQYSSKGKVPGINGNVDMDEVYESADLYSDDNVVVKPDIPQNNTCNINIKEFQEACNKDGYSKKTLGHNLKEDGIDGPETQAVRKPINLMAKLNPKGYWETKSMGELVKWLQTRLTEMGINPGKIDGYYGQNTRKAVINFQGKYNLKVDGIAGYNTLTMLFYV